MRRSVIAAALAAALSTSFFPASAIPPEAAGVLASSNIDHVITIPDVDAIGAKVIGDYMYVTTIHGLRIYNVSEGIPVLTGALPMPHWENEAVDTNGETLLISADGFLLGGTGTNLLIVVDVSNKNVPLVRGITNQYDGHTATCIKNCDYAWTSGGESYDLRDKTNPRPLRAGYVQDSYTHNWNLDATGYAWGDGQYVFNTNASNGATAPVQLQGPDGPELGYFGWHNSIRPDASNSKLTDNILDAGELVIGAGEGIWDFVGTAGNCVDDDRVTTSWFRRLASGKYRVDQLDTWNVGAKGTLPNAKPTAATFCSSHWLDHQAGLVAVGWYEQGTRILDVSNPSNIRQVGYFMPVETQTWAAYFKQVADGPFGGGTYVYAIDVIRGIDVFKIDATAGMSPTVLAPYLNPTMPGFAPSDRFGWACRVPSASGLEG